MLNVRNQIVSPEDNNIRLLNKYYSNAIYCILYISAFRNCPGWSNVRCTVKVPRMLCLYAKIRTITCSVTNIAIKQNLNIKIVLPNRFQQNKIYMKATELLFVIQ